MKPIPVILTLWVIALVATLLVAGGGAFTYLGPVFAVCMIGSVFVLRQTPAES